MNNTTRFITPKAAGIFAAILVVGTLAGWFAMWLIFMAKAQPLINLLGHATPLVCPC